MKKLGIITTTLVYTLFLFGTAVADPDDIYWSNEFSGNTFDGDVKTVIDFNGQLVAGGIFLIQLTTLLGGMEQFGRALVLEFAVLDAVVECMR